MKNIIIAGVIIVIGAVVFLAHPFKSQAPEVTNIASTTTEANVEDVSSTTIKTPAKSTPTYSTDKATRELQIIWDKYLAAAKIHDLKTISELSYQLSDNCKHPETTQKECFVSMDVVVKAFEKIKTTDLTVAWKDAKQAILMTEPRPDTFDGNTGFYQPRLYFGVKDGTYKLIAVFPDWGVFANKDKVKAGEVQAFLAKALVDSDKDGISDLEENCDDGTGAGTIKGCTKTNLFNKDENKDGWWDGIDPYIR
ncbi:MAG: hypothetical protein WA051_01390 [Minisyncoccia bacterium]